MKEENIILQRDLERWLDHYQWRYTKNVNIYTFSFNHLKHNKEEIEDLEYEIDCLFIHIGKKYNRHFEYIFIDGLSFAYKLTSEPYNCKPVVGFCLCE